jgi:hypothetical protein
MRSRPALISAALAVSLPIPVQAHDIYSHLRDPWGRSCCSGTDCRPALYQRTTSGVRMFVDRRWIDVPDGTIQYRALPGDTGESHGAHWCGMVDPLGDGFGPVHVTCCAILPPRTASARSEP